MGRTWVGRGKLAASVIVGLSTAAWLLPRAGLPSSVAADADHADVNRSAEMTDDRMESIDAADSLDAPALQQKFLAIAQETGPAVVAISGAEQMPFVDGIRPDDLTPQRLEGLLAHTTRTVGTGFFFDSDGYILTNEHVIEDSAEFWVTTDDKRVFPAIVVASDARADLAVLKIPARHQPTVRFAAGCQRGQWALTLGNPYGLATEGEMALSVGVVSATGRSLPSLASKEDRLYCGLIQTTAQINPGNSGGPLLDLDGRVLGINTAVIMPQKQTNGIGFAIPATADLLVEVDQLRQGWPVIYGYLGVTVTNLSSMERAALGLPDSSGVRVESVETGSPAAAADGLKAGDVVVQFDGQDTPDTDRFVRLVGSAEIDKSVKLRVLRGGKLVLARCKPTRRMTPSVLTNHTDRIAWCGMTLGPTPDNWPVDAPVISLTISDVKLPGKTAAKEAKTGRGLMVMGIEDASPLRKEGVTAGCVIDTVAGHPVSSVADLQRIIEDKPAASVSVIAPVQQTEVVASQTLGH